MSSVEAVAASRWEKIVRGGDGSYRATRRGDSAESWENWKRSDGIGLIASGLGRNPPVFGRRLGTALPCGPRTVVRAKVGPDGQLKRGKGALLSSAGPALERKEA